MSTPTRIIVLTLALAVAGCGNKAQNSNQGAGTAEKASDIYQKPAATAGNTVCPVSGHKVPDGGGTVVQYEGNNVHLCCADCVEPFKSNPAKYMAALEKGEGAGDVPESMQGGH